MHGPPPSTATALLDYGGYTCVWLVDFRNFMSRTTVTQRAASKLAIPGAGGCCSTCLHLILLDTDLPVGSGSDGRRFSGPYLACRSMLMVETSKNQLPVPLRKLVSINSGVAPLGGQRRRSTRGGSRCTIKHQQVLRPLCFIPSLFFIVRDLPSSPRVHQVVNDGVWHRFMHRQNPILQRTTESRRHILSYLSHNATI